VKSRTNTWEKNDVSLKAFQEGKFRKDHLGPQKEKRNYDKNRNFKD
jgi:hypothetical protein